MSVFVTHSYFYKQDPKQWRAKQPYPPLGTLQAAAVLREAGLGIYFCDSNLKENPEVVIHEMQQAMPKYTVIYDDGFNYLTKMCLTVMRSAALKIAVAAKRLNSVVILCSSDSTDHYEKYLLYGVDYVVRGEGEETLRDLLLKLENQESADDVQGIAFMKNGNTVVNLPRPVLRHLDALPLPAWDLVEMEDYRRIWMKHHGYFSLNVATTRGCPYKCNWCAKPIYGNRYHSRSAEHVVNEIEFLLTKYKPDHFWMCDDIFGLRPGWVQQFQRLVAERKLNFKYKIQSRADLLLQETTIEALKKSGAETVWVGAESGSQKILDAMEKGTTVQQIREAARLLKQHHIRPAFFLQFGYLGETHEDIQSTINLVLETMPDEIGISVSYPLPGTRFHEKVKDMLKAKQNWTDSDDLAMLFKNTYPPAYYKILHRYVHSRFRIQRGINQFRKSFSWSKAGIRNILSMIYHVPLAWINGYRLKLSSRHE
jgi:anaerobic magnesium-protoporphyrin IX monomethyl ester cyclase